jgi:hypothetical protein
VAPNTVPSERVATIAVTGHTVQLRQAAAPCTYGLRRSGDSIGSAGGSLAVNIDTLTGCGWTSSSDASWLTVTSGQSGNASSIVALLVAANQGAARIGHLIVGGQTYTVTQAAAGTPTAPDPTPEPPPPGGTTTKEDGKIDKFSGRCPNVAFTIRGTRIVADSSTDYRKGDCEDLRNGREVVVTGTVEPDHTVYATRIELKK